MEVPDVDIVRLSLPLDDELRPVVEVTVGVVARRWGLSDVEVAAVRAAAGDALGALEPAEGAPPVLVEVHGWPHHLDVHMIHGDARRTISAPPP